MATNAIPNCGVTPSRVSWQRKQKTWMLIFVKSTLQNYKKRWYCLPMGSVSCGEGAKKVNSVTGVINCRFECGYRTVTVHRLSYMLEHKMTRVEPGLDASHLCHNSLCLTASHISMEPHSINNNRQYCVSQNVCFGHAPYPKCMLQFKVFQWQCNSKTYIFLDVLNPSVFSKCRLL